MIYPNFQILQLRYTILFFNKLCNDLKILITESAFSEVSLQLTVYKHIQYIAVKLTNYDKPSTECVTFWLLNYTNLPVINFVPWKEVHGTCYK